MEKKIKKLIIDFVRDYPKEKELRSMWQEPLVKFSDAEDEMYLKLKEVVSPTHALPKELLPGAKTVIAYFIPFKEYIIQSNIEGKLSSWGWAEAYAETNSLINSLNTHINKELEKLNYRSNILPATHNFDEDILLSDWSHRHVAYISGLGKFGLNNMLITEKGCCGRLGSIVTNLNIEPSTRNNEEYCLYKTSGTCKNCVKQCVNDALKDQFFDRFKCYDMLLENAEIHKEVGLADACGKCCVNLPCSTKVPIRSGF
ncbi:epoxyqueuosine reductase [Alkalicella caledoniensis]|uniref:Epoxyqueuosine reductase n=1 Tax=Alkalicella caledoniensis TaxID=2731377 RepID=A0A7G9W6A5_ALKCA|nr:epoxyqueuosine reductase [Alkalicella caledoniensis]QNO14217.1 epoxyqueuosine reductase [Alkalicella caledoniensis]